MPMPTPQKGQGHAAAHDECLDVRWGRAQRQTDAHFAAALANQIGDEPIDAYDGEAKRNGRKRCRARAW